MKLDIFTKANYIHIQVIRATVWYTDYVNPYQPAIMRFTPRIVSMALWAWLTALLTPLSAQSGCPDIISLEESTSSLEIHSPWTEGTTTYSGELQVRSQTGVSLSLKSLTLRDEDMGTKIDPEQVSISSPVNVPANELQEIRITLNNVTAPGNYEGMLLLSGRSTGGDSCEIDLPFIVNLYETGKIVLINPDAPVAVNTVPDSWLNFILPTRIKGTGFSVDLKNTGQSTVEINDYSLYFQGSYNSNYISDSLLELASGPVRILPGHTEKVAFKFAKGEKVEIDSYSGEVSLHLANRNESVSKSVSINRRMGVAGALIALLLGIFVGRMMKDLNKQTSQDQVALIEKFVPLRAMAANLEDKVAKNRLLVRLSETEDLINKVKDEATKVTADAALAKTALVVNQVVEWEALFFRVNERAQTSGYIKDPVYKQAVEELNQARDMIFAGDEEGVKNRLTKVDQLTQQMQPEPVATRSLDPETGEEMAPVDPPTPNPGVQESLSELTRSMENIAPVEVDPPQTSTSTFWRRAEDILFRVLDVLTGVQVNARVRYAVFRPIAMIVAFTVLVLLGFQEIYVNGSLTFGDEGIYDYLKLFLWGVVSDVFSRSLAGNTGITSFVDSAKKAAPPTV